MRRKQKIFIGGIALILGISLALRNRHPSPATVTSVPAGTEESRRADRDPPPGPANAAQKAFQPSEIDAPEEARQAIFAQKLRLTLKSLPKKSELQKLGSEAAHHAPAPILDAGRALGEVAEAVQKDPSLAPAALKFYRACAQDDAKADSIRALCLSNAEKGQNGTVKGVPDRVRRLSRTLSF